MRPPPTSEHSLAQPVLASSSTDEARTHPSHGLPIDPHLHGLLNNKNNGRMV